MKQLTELYLRKKLKEIIQEEYNIYSSILYLANKFYNFNLSNLQRKGHNCLKTFSVNHEFSCGNRGLVITLHNELRDKIIHILKQYSPPNFVRSKPLIHLGCRRPKDEVSHRGRVLYIRGDVLIQGLWESHT